MKIRLRPILLTLLLAAAVVATAITQAPASQLITFADENATWDWQVTCQDALQAWVQQSPNPIRTIRVTLTDEKNLGVSTVGIGCPGDKDQAAIAYAAYAACDGKPDLACRVAIQHGAPGDDLNVAVTAAIPHGGVPRFSAQT